MDTWNEKTVRREIDEIIIESYLLCLSEHEVRSYLRHFLDTCEAVIESSDGGSRDLRFATVRIAMLKAYLLLSADSLTFAGPAKHVRSDAGDYEADLRRFVEQVVSARSLILRLLDGYDPELSKGVREDCERKSVRRRRNARKRITGRILIVLAMAGVFAAVVMFAAVQMFVH